MHNKVREFEELRQNEEDLDTYMKLDHFNAKQHEDDIKDKRFSKSRIRWEGPDSYTVNDKA